MPIIGTNTAPRGLATTKAIQASFASQRIAIQHPRGPDRDSNVEVEYTAARDCLGCSASEARSSESSIIASDTIANTRSQVSSVYITLFAVSHASRSRSPLPQFLPSPREALTKWGKAVERLLADSRPASGTQSPAVSETDSHAVRRQARTPTAMDLAALYAFAEREALSRLCDILDEVRITLSQIPQCTDFYSNRRSSLLENSLASKPFLHHTSFPLNKRTTTYNSHTLTDYTVSIAHRLQMYRIIEHTTWYNLA
jgi:hypothetical protein